MSIRSDIQIHAISQRKRKSKAVRPFLFIAGLVFPFVAAAQAARSRVDLHYVDEMPNTRHPELVYWFFTPETLMNKQYLRDIDHLAKDSPFTFAFLTHRNGINFSDSEKIHPALKELVSAAHERGLKIGLQIDPSEVMDTRSMTTSEEQSLVSEGETTLDAGGKAKLSLAAVARSAKPTESRLLKVVAFRKTGDGFYDPASLVDLTNDTTTTSSAAGSISVEVHGGAANAGKTVYVLSENYFHWLDLFSDSYSQLVRELIGMYKDIPLDGTDLDEFSYMHIFGPGRQPAPFRDRMAGDAFARSYTEKTGQPFVETLFAMRYAPEGRPGVRIKAIDEYWDFLRKGPLRIEQEFYNESKKTFGAKTFIGIHNTFHNSLTNDEAWSTGLNWWVNPRDYGQSDEDLPLPTRMGLLVSHPEPVMYDQYYGFDISKFTAKAIRDARFDARLHYHGYNDTERYGVNLASEAFLKAINPVERKIRLLNQFDPAAPELPVLVVFGMPALLNWYPETAKRNSYDINGSLEIEPKALAIWNAGYRCALVPSDLIDSGQITLDVHNHPTINGHRFQAIVYLDPQYAKPKTLSFLEKYEKAGGKLMLEGTATADFEGIDIRERFQAIVAQATVKSFDVDKVVDLGIQPNAMEDGARLEDGSVLLTDLPSIENNKPRPFDLQLGNHQFTGSYVGILAIQANTAGKLEKFACGQCSLLLRDGKTILSLTRSADVVLLKGSGSSFRGIIQGKQSDSNLTLSIESNHKQ